MSGDLCVFLVDNGSTHEFSVEKYVGAQVEALQFGIFEELGIEPQNQVLIMENGIQLQPNRKLAQYSCGTGDANPIFLFSKQTIQNPDPPSASVHNHSYEAADIRTELEQSLKQTNATIDLVQSRTDLASRVVQLDQRLATETESLARDQHLQHQGWLASVANLEMYTENVLNLNDLLSAEISESRDQLGKCDQLLAQLPESFDCLKCLPVPPSVAENLTTLSGHNQSSSNCSNLSSPLFNSSPLEQQAFGTGEVVETAGFCASMSPKTMSLYEYLSKHERFYDLDELGSQMEYHLSHYTPHSLQTLSNDVTAVVDEIRTSQDMKRIRNFTVRIEDLVKSGKQLEKAMERQEILHRSFLSLKNQFQTVPDRSVLGDLCFTHVKQLQEMSELHMRIVQVNNYNKMAKDELSQNLHLRLQWIVKMQAKLVRCESQIAMRRENLKRIVARIQLLEQLIVAPQYAVEILSEVYRRKNFSTKFLQWGTKVSSDAESVLREESERRTSFTQNTASHFLYWLFPSLREHFPIQQMLRCPEFDTQLPDVTKSEVESIAQAVPSLAHLCPTVETILKLPFESNTSTVQTQRSRGHVSLSSTSQTEKSGSLVNTMFYAESTNAIENEPFSPTEGEEFSTLTVVDLPNTSNFSDPNREHLHQEDDIESLSKRLLSLLNVADPQLSSSTRDNSSSLASLLEYAHSHHSAQKELSNVEPMNKPSQSTEAECQVESCDLAKADRSVAGSEVQTQTDEERNDGTSIPSSASDSLLCQSFHAQAESQAYFNMALSALSKEKNSQILQLRKEIKLLKGQLKTWEKFSAESGSEDNFHDKKLWNLGVPMSRTTNYDLERSLEDRNLVTNNTVPKRIDGYNPSDQSKSLSVVVDQPKPMTDSEATVFEAEAAKSVNASNSKLLEQSLFDKSEEMSTSTAAENQMTATLSASVYQIKIVLNDFRANDLVLIEFDQLSGHYKLISVANTPCFLHEGCYERLGIDFQSKSEIKRKTIGVFVNKELCKVRKPNNRFNLQMGQKFYRVKAEAWARPQQLQEQQHSQPQSQTQPGPSSQ